MGDVVDSIVLIVVGLAGLGGLAKLGSWIGGKTAPWLGLVFPVLGVLSVPALIGWVLDQFGTVQRAVVLDKRESIRLLGNGGWAPRYSVTIMEPAAPPGEMIRLRADQPTYDALNFGDPVEVRWLPVRKSIVRLEMMPSSGWLRSFAAFELAGFSVSLAMVFGGILLFGGAGTAGIVRKAIAAALIGYGGSSCYREARPYRGEGEPPAPTVATTGTVRQAWTIRGLYPVTTGETRRGWSLTEPYLVVAAEFTPAGARSSVLGIDAIDAESVSHLRLGDQVGIRYSRSAPRQARLAFGTRTFPVKNVSDTRIALGIAIGCFVLVSGLRWWLGAARRQPKGPRQTSA